MKKRKILRPIHYNRGIEAKYRSRLEKLIEAMTNSYEYLYILNIKVRQ
jgi:hypothetical protein